MTANRLDRSGAIRRAQRARDCMMTVAEAIDTLIEIQERQDWLALGYKTWAEYCEKEFGPDRLKLSPEQRGQVVAVLVASGMPKRRVAAALGVTEGTVRNDVKKSRPQLPGVRNDYALPAGDAQVSATGDTKDPVVPTTEGTTDGGTSTSKTEEPPAAGTGADPVGEADRPVPAVTPQTTEEPPPLGDEDTAGAPLSEAQPPTTGLVPAEGDETGAGPASAPVDGEGRQVQAGVSGPAVPSPEQPKELIEWFAARWERVDADVSGPLLTSADLAAIYADLDRIAFIVGLLDKWHQRTQP